MKLSAKPHIRPCRDPWKPGKWECISVRTAGGHVIYPTGKAYSPEEAYDKWQRSGEHGSRRPAVRRRR